MARRTRYPIQHFSVPADWRGRLFLWLLRRYMGPRYTFRLKSRGVKPRAARRHIREQYARVLADHPGILDRPGGFLHDRTPLPIAARWGVYLVDRPAAISADKAEVARARAKQAAWAASLDRNRAARQEAEPIGEDRTWIAVRKRG
ncbi:MAG TPA: hypothetical protein VMW52_05465 [Phycisphaerae bacterium]|nr:hypothetical protein [Phycisphaerae bacterium]